MPEINNREPVSFVKDFINQYVAETTTKLTDRAKGFKDDLQSHLGAVLKIFKNRWKEIIGLVASILLCVGLKFNIRWLVILAIGFLILCSVFGVYTIVKDISKLLEIYHSVCSGDLVNLFGDIQMDRVEQTLDLPEYEMSEEELFAFATSDLHGKPGGLRTFLANKGVDVSRYSFPTCQNATDQILNMLTMFLIGGGVMVSKQEVKNGLFAVSTVKQGVETISWVVTKIFNFVTFCAGKLKKWVNVPECLLDPSGNEKWIERVESLLQKNSEGALPITAFNVSVLKDLYADGLSLAVELRRNRQEPKAQEVVSHCRKIAEAYREMQKVLHRGSQKRAAPLGIYLCGPPGTGKSNLMSLIAASSVVS